MGKRLHLTVLGYVMSRAAPFRTVGAIAGAEGSRRLLLPNRKDSFPVSSDHHTK